MGKPDLRVLLESAKRCQSIAELKSLMETNGIWFNDAAATATYHAIESARSRPCDLSDAALAQVTAGTGVVATDDVDRMLIDLFEVAVGQQGLTSNFV